MAEIKYVDWDGLVYYDGKIKEYVDTHIQECVKWGGSSTIEDLPSPSFENLNYIYRITEDFTSTDHFEKPGYIYEAGTIVQVTSIDNVYLYTIFNEIDNVKPDQPGDDSSADLTGINTRVEDVEKRVSNNESDIESLENSTQDLLTKVSNLKSDVADLDESTSLLDSRLTTVEETTNKIDNSVEDITTDVTSLKQTILTVENSVSSLDEAVKNNQSNIESNTNLIQTKQDRLVSGNNISTINGKSLLTGEDIQIDVDEIVCTIDKETEIEVGGISVGTNLYGLTFNEILKMMLFKAIETVESTFTPTVTAPPVLDVLYTAYTGSSVSNDFILVSDVSSDVLVKSDKNTLTYTDQGVYQIVDSDGNVTETGYQIAIPASGRTATAVLVVPESVTIKEVYIYDPLNSQWTLYNGEFTAREVITQTTATDGTVVNYIIYDDSNTSSGTRYFRVVIE